MHGIGQWDRSKLTERSRIWVVVWWDQGWVSDTLIAETSAIAGMRRRMTGWGRDPWKGGCPRSTERWRRRPALTVKLYSYVLLKGAASEWQCQEAILSSVSSMT